MSLRTLDRHTLSSVFKVGFVTALLSAFMLLGVDLFTNIYTYLDHGVGLLKGFSITLLYFPEAFLLVLGPSFLFSVSYYLSSLYSSNEIMCILSSGTSFARVISPIVGLAIALSLFSFAFNEKVAIACSNEKKARIEAITSGQDSSSANYDIDLSDMQSHYTVHAKRYSDYNESLYDVSLILCNEDQSIDKRIDAYKATYDKNAKNWVFYDVVIYTPTEDGTFSIEKNDQYVSIMDLPPSMFRNSSNEISTMDLKLAYSYVQRMKGLNITSYYSVGSAFYKRIFSCLTPLVMILIACSMNYSFKKNVLFFTLVCSICLCVAYFVVQMVTMMLSDQGVIAPYLGSLIPFAAIIVVSFVLGLVLRRQ